MPGRAGWTPDLILLGLFGLFAGTALMLVDFREDALTALFQVGFLLAAIGPLVCWIMVPVYRRWWGHRTSLASLVLLPAMLAAAGLLLLAALPLPSVPAKAATNAPITASVVGKAPVLAPSGPPPAPVTGRAGAVSLAQGVALTVASPIDTPAADGKKLLAVDIVLACPGRNYLPYSLSQFKLKDAQGRELVALTSEDAQKVVSGALQRGQQVRGTLRFAVPGDATGLVLDYTFRLEDGHYQTIRVALS